MIVSMLLFAQLSAACAPGDASDTLARVARIESNFDTLAIHDNKTGATYKPDTLETAITLASDLIVEKRHSIDLGLMQINSGNFARLGLSIRAALDACHSMRAGSKILRDDYRNALRTALSLYNTGDPVRGITNGYVARVEAAHVRIPRVAEMTAISVGTPVNSSTLAVLDILHSDLIPTKSSDEVINLILPQTTE